MTFSAKEAIRCAVLTKPSNAWPTFDGGNLQRCYNLTASEAAVCVRRLAFNKKQEERTVPIEDFWESMDPIEFQARVDSLPDDSELGIFERGHNVEAWAVKMLEAALNDDETLMFTGENQRSFYLARYHVSGTPDGVYVDHTAKTFQVLEIKSSDNRMSGPRKGHVKQLLLNMGIIQSLLDSRHPIIRSILAGYDMGPGILLYINPSNHLSMDEFMIEYDSGETLVQAQLKSGQLFKNNKDGTVAEIRDPKSLPPEGLAEWGGCTFCNHKDACLAIENEKKHKATVETLTKIMQRTNGKVPQMPVFAADAPKEQVLRVIADYAEFNRVEKDAAAHKQALRSSIVSWVKEQGNMSVEFEDSGRLFKASLSVADRKGSFDSDKLEDFLAQHDESLENFRKGPSKVETLLVSVVPAT